MIRVQNVWWFVLHVVVKRQTWKGIKRQHIKRRQDVWARPINAQSALTNVVSSLYPLPVWKWASLTEAWDVFPLLHRHGKCIKRCLALCFELQNAWNKVLVLIKTDARLSNCSASIASDSGSWVGNTERSSQSLQRGSKSQWLNLMCMSSKVK